MAEGPYRNREILGEKMSQARRQLLEEWHTGVCGSSLENKKTTCWDGTGQASESSHMEGTENQRMCNQLRFQFENGGLEASWLHFPQQKTKNNYTVLRLSPAVSQNLDLWMRQSLGPQRSEILWVDVKRIRLPPLRCPYPQSALPQVCRMFSTDSWFLYWKKKHWGRQLPFPPSWIPWQETSPCSTHGKHHRWQKGEILLRTGRDKERRRDYHPHPWKLCSIIRAKKTLNQSCCSTALHVWSTFHRSFGHELLASLSTLPGYVLWEHLGQAVL